MITIPYETESPFAETEESSKIGLIREIFSTLEKDPKVLAVSDKKYPYGDLFDNLYDRPLGELKNMIKIRKRL